MDFLQSNYAWISFLPIVVLLALSLWQGVKTGIFAGLAFAAAIFLASGGALMVFWASLASAFVGTVNILMIIFGAILLYHVMEVKGYVEGLKSSLDGIHGSRDFKFYFLTLFLTAFFESVAGFGTPATIVPLLLIALGYGPVLSIGAVLLVDGLFALTGAVGTPMIAGLEAPLGLNTEQVGLIYRFATFGIMLVGLVVLLSLHRSLSAEGQGGGLRHGVVLFAAVILPYVLLAPYLRELAGVVASLLMAVFSFFFLFEQKRFDWRAWSPYLLLVGLLLIPKLFPALEAFLARKLEFRSLFGTSVSASVQPMRSPLVPFMLATGFALLRVKDRKVDYRPVASKTFSVFVVLFPSLSITQLMLNGDGELPSMIGSISGVLVQAGKGYPLVAPLIGVVGAFITGSTTVSNIIFGALQQSSAQDLGLPQEVVLGQQLSGASLGNAISQFNIIAAGTAAGVNDFKGILKMNLLPVLAGAAALAGLGYLALSVGWPGA